ERGQGDLAFATKAEPRRKSARDEGMGQSRDGFLGWKLCGERLFPLRDLLAQGLFQRRHGHLMRGRGKPDLDARPWIMAGGAEELPHFDRRAVGPIREVRVGKVAGHPTFMAAIRLTRSTAVPSAMRAASRPFSGSATVPSK